MNAYLVIAQKVLAAIKKPLSAREILECAYMSELMPYHLYGATQHKTLQARISEDIRKHGERSLFYRTDRGVFYLKSLRDKSELSDKEKAGIEARPRYRELNKYPVLKVSKDALIGVGDEFINPKEIGKFLVPENHEYKLLKDKNAVTSATFWVFVIVRKENSILTYRHGRYRENRDGFINHRSIGFTALLKATDKTFLDQEDHGVITVGISSTYADLGVPLQHFNLEEEKANANIEFLTYFENEKNAGDLICVVTYNSPNWLEPLKRRLAINNLEWLSCSTMPNNMQDFDAWSQRILPELFRIYRRRGILNVSD
jgi:hypothetical protein